MVRIETDPAMPTANRLVSIEEAEALAYARRQCATGIAKSIRIAAGLTVGEVAAACGITHPVVSRWELKRRVPHGEAAVLYGRLLRRLADAAREAS
jgi:DNA-binding transcriptional regulator YiaG